ncbi:uncharacterized protein LOC119696504 [Motacilla alba alba]|uniref:uncharacterized protein LOC119696504 n=1 Tax=Motacilla alba alba TaxID=1094192 RepID=UPI0018D57FA2|nr:uncharacterized protein LOC119696504 [Motacilla alba alba]
MARTQEQDPARGLFRRTAQLVCKLIKRIREEETSTMGTGLRAYSHIFKTKTSAALLDMLVEEGFSNPKQVSSLWPGFHPPSNCLASQATPAGPCEPLRPWQRGGKGSTSLGKLGTFLPLAAFQISPCLLQVPAMVRYIHQWLMANQFAEHRLNRTLLDLTEAQPADVLMTLLRVAPSCDRYGAQLPRGLRAPQPISLCSLCQVSEQQRVPGPSGCSLCQPWHGSPQACCHAASLPLRGLSPQGWAAGCCWPVAVGRGRAGSQLRSPLLPRPQCCVPDPPETEL